MELLVVLLIMSLLSAIAMPRLSTLFSSVNAAFNRDEVFSQINALGYKALRQGQGFALQYYPLIKSEQDSDEGYEVEPSAQSQPLDIPLQLPEGWRISGSQPIYFFANGACGGGVLLLHFEQQQYTLKLPPPFCQARFTP